MQKLLYRDFKLNKLPDLIRSNHPPSLARIHTGLKKIITDLIPEFSKRPDELSRQDWQIYQAEMEIGISALRNYYYDLANKLRSQLPTLEKVICSLLKTI